MAANQRQRREHAGPDSDDQDDEKKRRRHLSWVLHAPLLLVLALGSSIKLFFTDLVFATHGLERKININHSNDSTNVRSYSILPKKIYSVIGLESSGTNFVSKLIEDALHLSAYREGSRSCNITCNKGLHCPPRMKRGETCHEHADVHAQHFSLPWGGTCTKWPNPPVVDVVLPSQCTRDHRGNATEIEQCNGMANDLWGVHLDGRAMTYPKRYQLDIVKNKEWYEQQGVDYVVVIVIRDEQISLAARGSHCANIDLRKQEEEVGTELIVRAINKYILSNGDKHETKLRYWKAQQYQKMVPKKRPWKSESKDNAALQLEKKNDSKQPSTPNKMENGDHQRMRKLGALPSKDGIVVVSYESFVKLGATYVQMMYDALGIESDFVPEILNSNKKYLNHTMA